MLDSPIKQKNDESISSFYFVLFFFSLTMATILLFRQELNFASFIDKFDQNMAEF